MLKVTEKIDAKRAELDNKSRELNVISEIMDKLQNVKMWYGELNDTETDYTPYESTIIEMNTINHVIDVICKEYKL